MIDGNDFANQALSITITASITDLSLVENQAIGTLVGSLNATDPDGGCNHLLIGKR